MSVESECTLVSSRGILKSCDVHSRTPVSSSGNDYQHLLALLIPSNQHPNMTIYVCTETLPMFVTIILNRIEQPFMLVTGDSDCTVPNEVLSDEQFKNLINNPYLIRWAGQNMKYTLFPKMMQIPIGLDYHTLASNPTYGGWAITGEDNSCKGQEIMLQTIRTAAAPFRNRIYKVYTNAHHRLDRYGDRVAACEQIPADLLIKENAIIPRSQVWDNYARYAFVASPFGNGIDCHRTWEALCCGAIPIIRGKFLMDLFDNLPVLRVSSWSDVTAELLEQTIEEFSTRTFNYEKLTLKYWMDRIKAPATLS